MFKTMLAALAFSAVVAPQAHAWSAEGHRLTGMVAEGLLSPDAKAGLKKLMGKVDLAAASLVLDQQKDALDQRIPGSRKWHYDDRPVCDAAAKPASYCPDGNCASVQIQHYYGVLVDEHSTRKDKQFAVQVLVHLVGDIHQPLHASDHDDAGGNAVFVDFTLPSGTQRHNVKLHSAWDDAFVAAALGTANERAIAKGLLDKISESERKEWQRGSATSWLRQSYKIAVDTTYGKLPGFACTDDDFASENLVLDDDYVKAAIAVVPQQISRAGARIAWLLNRAFAK